ncbi:hydrogenase maturation protease [Bacteroidota bacterium]
MLTTLEPHKLEDKNILFVGIGNVLRSDDGVGVYIAEKIQRKKNINTLIVEVSIENYIRKINDLNPEILVLIDSVNFNKEPGYKELKPIEEIQDYIINTHNISLKRVCEFFKMPVYILGIQPKTIKIAEGLSPEVKQVAERIIEEINLGF